MNGRILTLCGSDTLAQAGLAADLRAFVHFKIQHAFVITAYTSQDSKGVSSITARNPAEFEAELRFVLKHFCPDVVKIGMIPNEKIVFSISNALSRLKKVTIVLDPIYQASSGDKLITEKGYAALKKLLLPGAIVTPNIPEAERLCGFEIRTLDDRRKSARFLLALGARAVIIKGGHAKGDASDIIMIGKEIHILRAKPIVNEKGRRVSRRGSGCAFSAALAAKLARGKDLVSAVRSAKGYVRGLLAKRGHSRV